MDAQELMAALVEVAQGNKNVKKKGTKEITTTVQRSSETRTIIVPEGMGLLEASKELADMHKNQEQVIDVDYTFDGWDWKDALIATKIVSEITFGWINGVTQKTMMGEQRPSEIDVIIDYKNGEPVVSKCFTGSFSIAAWDKALATVGFNGMNAYIVIKAKKKYTDVITQYFQAIETHLRTNSIYRGKTVVVTDKKNNSGTNFDYEIIEKKQGDTIILNDGEQLVLDQFIIPLIGQPGKRSYLFTGPYGNGKTETAMQIGRLANDQNLPFFYIKDSSLFETVLNRSKKYQPCVIFLEDIDEIGSGEERGERMNKILNTLDGVQTKGNSITVIFTTNHEKKINKALRRPGRIDEVIRFINPDVKTRAKIMETYLQGIEGANKINYLEIAETIEDVSGSVVAQMAKKAVMLALRTGSATEEGVRAAIKSMEYQIQFMKDEVEGEPKEKQFVRIQSELLNAPVQEEMSKLRDFMLQMARAIGMKV